MTLSEQQRNAEAVFIGRWVQIDSSGNKGQIVSVSVTSDGFVIGRTRPGHDRGVFLGRAPERGYT